MSTRSVSSTSTVVPKDLPPGWIDRTFFLKRSEEDTDHAHFKDEWVNHFVEHVMKDSQWPPRWPQDKVVKGAETVTVCGPEVDKKAVELVAKRYGFVQKFAEPGDHWYLQDPVRFGKTEPNTDEQS